MPPVQKVNETINEALINDILMIYSDAEDKMLKAVAKRVAKGIKSEGWNETKLKDTQALKKEIEKVLGDTQKLSNTTVSKGIINAYKSGVQEVGGVKGVHQTILDELDIPMNLKMLVLSTNQLLDNASFQVLRKANDAYQQVMAHATTGLLAGTDTRIQASQKMLNEFASKGITSFVDKAGRNWDLGSYAEMCARTVGSHAALQGHIDRQVEVGEDLVKVSTIGTTCPICQRWQGVVLSISGNNPKYHSLEEAKASGLFHPNCKHTLGMFIPELDGEGKVEPEPYNDTTYSSQRNKLIEQQRANERNIRYWKKRRALAITPEEQKKCDEKVKAWQYKNLIHCEKHGLRRQYAREGVMTGKATGPQGTFIGGSLKEYEEVFKSVVGQSPKTIFKLNLQFFASKTYQQWLKDEIQSLDELDVDKAMMKDANNKSVTPTSLYKKYIGDNPAQDYAEVSEYEKGTKEYKTGYAKWLKQQIEEIGVTYKVKPKYVEVHEDIPDEDKALSATNIYKKYYGEPPTEAYKKAGGEAGTGMKYGKWVETQKKELIKNGITKTVPFENATTQKTVDTISMAKASIDDAKEKVKQAELDKYKKELDATVHGQYDGYLKVKEAMEDTSKYADEKIKIAKEKHLMFVKKKAENMYGYAKFDEDVDKLKGMLLKETNPSMKTHIQAQIDVYEGVKAEKEAEKLHKQKLSEANDLLSQVKSGAYTNGYAFIKSKVKENFEDKSVANVYLSAYKEKKKMSVLKNISNDNEYDYYESEELKDFKEEYDKAKKDMPGSVEELIAKQKYEAVKEALEQYKKEKEEQEKAAKKAAKSGKVTLGREVRFDEGQLVKRDAIYQELNREDLEKLSEQVAGHKMLKASRRDVLGRDSMGRNHHMGHDVRLKDGLDDEERKLGEAFALAYDEYFNTIKCGPINEAYLKGYKNATPAMRKKIDAINMCIQSVELSEPIVLHRYIDRDLVDAIFHTTDVDSLRPGSLYENNTFMSTSVAGHPTFGKRNYMLTLQCDKGTHALPTINHEELEVLLGRGQLEVVRTNKYSTSKPNKLQNFDGSYTDFVGDEIVVRYIEDGKAYLYEEVDANKIEAMLTNQTNVSAHTKESKEWISSLSEDEMYAQKRYTGSYYSDMNNVYRKDDKSYSSAVKWSDDLTKALRRVTTNQPVVLRRGIWESDLAHMLGFKGDFSQVEAHMDEINKGGYAAQDKGFLSTSPYSSGGFTKDVELRIYCPTGTHAAYVDSISSHRGEKETLLQSGSIYKVHKIEKQGYKTIAYIELLGTD